MRPLEGIKVIDFTQGHGGSLTTMILADFGAEVIKVENLGAGDLSRQWEPKKNGNSAYYTYLNRGKKSVSVNMETEEGRLIIKKLIRNADIVCENLEFGAMDKMGFSYDALKQDNPGLIYASLTGFGKTGPLKDVKALDLQIQAMSGIMDITGFQEGPPTKVGAAFASHVGGTYMAMAINLALIHRKKSGEGQKIDIAMLDALETLLPIESFLLTYTQNVQQPPRFGNYTPSICPYDTFETNDGFVTIAFSTDVQFRKFCELFSLDEIANDERYATNKSRSDNYSSSLRQKIADVFINMSKFDIEKILEDAKLCGAAVCTVAESMESTQLAVRNMLPEVNDKLMGKIKIPGTVIKLKDTPGGVITGAPELGEHTAYYLVEVGYSSEQIKHLIDNGIVEVI